MENLDFWFFFTSKHTQKQFCDRSWGTRILVCVPFNARESRCAPVIGYIYWTCRSRSHAPTLRPPEVDAQLPAMQSNFFEHRCPRCWCSIGGCGFKQGPWFATQGRWHTDNNNAWWINNRDMHIWITVPTDMLLKWSRAADCLWLHVQVQVERSWRWE